MVDLGHHHTMGRHRSATLVRADRLARSSKALRGRGVRCLGTRVVQHGPMLSPFLATKEADRQVHGVYWSLDRAEKAGRSRAHHTTKPSEPL